jgi:hypothetical protein
METTNPRLTYQSLLAETDAEARDEYTYDPRVQMYAERDFEKDPDTFEQSGIQATTLDTLENVENLSGDALLDTLTLPVQSQPDMRERTRIIIIDTAMRDWTIQPDAYSNVFTFGSKRYLEYANAQVPYFFNNPIIPFDAYETPINFLNTGVAPGPRGDIPEIPNNKPQPFPAGVPFPSYLNRINSNLVYPTYGWRIVLSGGQRIHTPTSFSYGDPNIQVYFYPTYDAREPRGAQVGIDIQPKRYGVTGYSFYTETMLSNVTRIRLARATLPVTSLQPYKTSAFSISLEYPDSIQSKPYLFMSIDSLKGGYYGGAGTTVQTAFTALVQNDRTNSTGDSTFPSQYLDYKAWANEEYLFDPPISKLSNANIRLYTSLEQQLTHYDNLNIVDMVILNGSNLGKVKFFVTQNTAGSSSGFGISNIFTKNDVRIGDEITFYVPSITALQGDISMSSNLTQFIGLLSNDFLVTDICDSDFAPSSLLPIASFGTSFTAIPKIYGNLEGLVSTYNTLSIAVNTLSQICLQQYAGVSQVSLSFAQSRTFSKDYVVPILNVNLQPTYAFEITTLEPDTKKLQKIIPN